jgi:sodium transport system ATP-binding protein
MLTVESLIKRFKSVTAVNGVGFTARDGQITTLLGANGSGKTTTLSSLVGLLRPDAGRCLIDGIDVAGDAAAARRRLGWFPDSFGLYPRLTSREHLRYFGRLHGLSGAALEDSIAQTMAALGMDDIADRRTDGFSTGQQMKVALGRALVHQPQNLILDEPTRGLDVMSIRQLRQTLRQLKADGRCILLTSHVMAEVEELSDHIICIARGQVVADGTSAELKARTGTASLEDAFVALAA